MFDIPAKAKKRIYWQYKNAPKLVKWILTLPDIAHTEIFEQLEKIKKILDIDNSEGEQLNICGRIAGYLKRPVGKFYPSCQSAEVNDELYRRLIKAKICKNNGIATIDDIKAAADYILDVETIILDGQDMTMRLVWQDDSVDRAVQSLVEEYDLIPRPQGVGTRKHRVVKYRPFGFGRYNANFNHAPFWYGDGAPPVYYYESITLSWDGSDISGAINADHLNLEDIDVTLIIINENGTQSIMRTVTDSAGKFSFDGITPPAKVFARALLITPGCEVIELESEILIVT
ncbi:DUF2612 domain-containing protein [Pantoea stewartii]|uniref:DUF2612 domain-containing protein n=1 Tax=Pantoea stewartii TaxID=66269 RepID=UPI003366FD11